MKTTVPCTISTSTHYNKLLVSLAMSGLKLSDTCEGTYQAFAEVTELIRLLNAFPVYTPVLAGPEAAAFQKSETEMATRLSAGEDKTSILRDMMAKAGYDKPVIDLLFPEDGSQTVPEMDSANDLRFPNRASAPVSSALFRSRNDSRFDD